jgi:hypothetical protein
MSLMRRNTRSGEVESIARLCPEDLDAASFGFSLVFIGQFVVKRHSRS